MPWWWLQVCCWVHEELCLVANVGDAKAVLARRPPVEQVKMESVVLAHCRRYAGEHGKLHYPGPQAACLSANLPVSPQLLASNLLPDHDIP